MKFKAILAVILVGTLLVAAGLLFTGCQSKAAEQTAIAQRLDAEAALERAEADRLQVEAEAYQRRTEAATLAEVERSAMRQVERNASHERTVAMLPYVLVIAGLVAIGALAVVAMARRDQGMVDPGVILLLQRQQRQLDQLERATYPHIARIQRHQLPTDIDHQVVVYDIEEGKPWTSKSYDDYKKK